MEKVYGVKKQNLILQKLLHFNYVSETVTAKLSAPSAVPLYCNVLLCVTYILSADNKGDAF